MTWRIPLAKGHYATLISTHAPTLEAEASIKDAFYESLDTALLKDLQSIMDAPQIQTLAHTGST